MKGNLIKLLYNRTIPCFIKANCIRNVVKYLPNDRKMIFHQFQKNLIYSYVYSEDFIKHSTSQLSDILNHLKLDDKIKLEVKTNNYNLNSLFEDPIKIIEEILEKRNND